MSITCEVITSLAVRVAFVVIATEWEAIAVSTGGKVLMFSVMDDAFAELHSHRIEANAAYSQLYNYTFVHGVEPFGLTQEELAMPPTTYKVSAAWRLLAGRSLYNGPAVSRCTKSAKTLGDAEKSIARTHVTSFLKITLGSSIQASGY